MARRYTPAPAQDTKHPNITQWSYSRWKLYEECPRKAFFKFIKKYPEPSGDAMARGGEIHSEAERFIKGLDKTTSPNLVLVKEQLAELKKAKAKTELELAVTRAWEPTGWFDKDVWARAKLDVQRFLTPSVVEVIDWKTGQHKPGDEGYALQLELYGVFSFASWPAAKEVRAKLEFTDHGKTEPMTFKLKEYPGLKRTWEKRVTPMLNDTVYPPRPGNYCRWCAYAKGKGGPCTY